MVLYAQLIGKQRVKTSNAALTSSILGRCLGSTGEHAPQHLCDLLGLTRSRLLSSVPGKSELSQGLRLVVLWVKARS